MDVIRPRWAAPARVHALVTTRALGDMKSDLGQARLRALLPGEPAWLDQVHGTHAVEVQAGGRRAVADASFTRARNRVCAVRIADCMPVLFADSSGSVVGIAHAGWRGLCAGVLESTISAMGAPPGTLTAWLGPAIGARVYEVGDEVRDAFLTQDRASAAAFAASRTGHWLLDLCAVARQRLATAGVTRVSGGDLCTYSDPARFFSFRRDRAAERMAAAVWLT